MYCEEYDDPLLDCWLGGEVFLFDEGEGVGELIVFCGAEGPEILFQLIGPDVFTGVRITGCARDCASVPQSKSQPKRLHPAKVTSPVPITVVVSGPHLPGGF